MKFLNLHRRTSDPSLVPLFSIYLKRLRGLYRGGVRWLHHREAGEFWFAETRIDGENLHVELTPRDEAYFEFFTTGQPIVTGTVVIDGVTTPSAKAACVGVQLTTDSKGKLHASPTLLQGKRSFDGSELSRLKRPFQVQLVNEPVVNPPPKSTVFGRDKYPKLLFESYAPMHSHTGVFLRVLNKGPFTTYGYIPGYGPDHTSTNDYSGDSYQTLAGVHITQYDYTVNTIPTALNPMSAHATRDVGFDVPYMDGNHSTPVRTAVLNNLTVDWPRANGTIVVKDVTFGKRTFAIYIDAYSQFSVFPVSEIEAVDGTTQNVRSAAVLTVRPTLPAWVYDASGRFRDYYAAHSSAGLIDFPEYDWKMSPNGSKACAVVYERVAVDLDTSYIPSDQTTRWETYRDTMTGLGPFYGSTGIGFGSFAGAAQRYAVGPGLLEASITIALTGSAADQFTLDVTVAELRRPTTSPFCTFIAGYAWYDIGSYVQAGDLCVLDIERYYRLPPGNDGFGPTPRSIQGNEDALYSLKNLTTSTELASFPGPEGGRLTSETNLYAASLIDFDMATLSFVFSAGRVRSGLIDKAVLIYTLNTYRETVYPDNIPEVQKQYFTGEQNYRATMPTPEWIFMPLNDTRAWTDDVDLIALREHLMWEMNFKSIRHPEPWTEAPNTAGELTPANPINVPTYATKAWFAAVRAWQTTYGLALIANPMFGWYTHADLMIRALAKTPWSTLFTHPSGTWAFFDQSQIYNFGNPIGTYVTSVDVTKFEHFIIDRVHFELDLGQGRTAELDTTFAALYNQAIAKLPPEQTDFTAITSLAATFSFGHVVTTFWTWFKLLALWDGVTYSFEDEQFNNHPTDLSDNPLPPLQGGYRLIHLSFDAMWTNGASPQASAQHRTFSSCVLVQ